MILEINDTNAKIVYPYFSELHTVIPYVFLSSQENFAQSLLHDTSEGDEMFAELYTYAILSDSKVKGIVQYGIPNYEVRYDGERLYNSKIGVIRLLYFGLSTMSEGATLMKRALDFFKIRGVHSIKCFPHEYGLKVFAYHGKLYHSEHLVHWYLKMHGWKVSATSYYYTKSLKRMEKVSENRGYSFIGEIVGEEIEFFTICKHEKPIGGMQIHYVNNEKCAYMDFIYLTDEYQGRGWGSEALWQFMLILKEHGIQRMDTDMEEMNAIGQRLLEKCKFGKLGKSSSYERSL